MILRALISRLHAYWTLTKSLQTGLLLVTSVAGFASARCPVINWQSMLVLIGSLFLAIAGSTILNMVYDRDIDRIMRRTCWRPLPVGQVTVGEALALGIILCGLGVGWALVMKPLYGVLVLAGVVFNVIIYTLWLKRRTAYSIIIGGFAGAMPVLAGRTFALGHIDGTGLLMALAVLLWIPTHIMTFSIRYEQDYRLAGIPTFPSTYGVSVTRVLISLSSVGAGLAITIAALHIGMSWGYLRFLATLSVGLLALAVANVFRPSPRLNFGLFKYASLYMLISMLIVLVEGL